MRLRTWGHLWREALGGIRRNGLMSLASVTTVAICLIVLAAILLVAVNLQHMAGVAEDQVEVTAYVDHEFDRRLAPVLIERVQAIPGVAEALLITKEEGLVRLREQFGEQWGYLLEGYDDSELNPLRDAIEVRLDKPELAGGVAARLNELTSIEEVLHREDIVEGLLSVTRVLRLAGLGLVGLLGAATIFIVSNTIRLTVYARRREISIMKLVGATDAFIRWPFFLEGMLLGCVGAAAAGLVAWFGYDYIAASLARGVPFLPVADPRPLVWNLTKLLIGLGGAMGALGSAISVRRFLPA